jgi:hypothetical protein
VWCCQLRFFDWHSFHVVDFACMSDSYPVFWTPVDVTSEADFRRWENSNIWQLTIVFSLGSIRSNLITFCYLDIIDRGNLRTACFAFAVEVTDCYTDLAELSLQ